MAVDWVTATMAFDINVRFVVNDKENPTFILYLSRIYPGIYPVYFTAHPGERRQCAAPRCGESSGD